MRSSFLSIGLVACAVAAPLSAGHAQLTFGGFAGVNFANLDITNLDPDEATSSRTGFMFGGYVGKHMSRIFTVRIEGYWTRKGADLVSSGTTQGSFILDYLEFPVILRAQLPLVVVKPAIYAGPAISFKTSCNAEEASSGASVSCDDINVTLKSTDFSGIVGAGVGIGPVIVDVQYDFSLSNILDDPNTTTEVKNETWTVRASFGI